MNIKKSQGIPKEKVVFETILEDIAGGGIIASPARIPSDVENGVIEAGQLLNLVDGEAEVVKTCKVVTGGTTTAPRVEKGHLVAAGEFYGLNGDGQSRTVQTVDKTNADYDVITFNGAITGATAGAVLIEVSAEEADSEPLYEPNCLLRLRRSVTNNSGVALDNINVSGVVRGTVREENLPAPIADVQKNLAEMSLIRFK